MFKTPSISIYFLCLIASLCIMSSLILFLDVYISDHFLPTALPPPPSLTFPRSPLSFPPPPPAHFQTLIKWCGERNNPIKGELWREKTSVRRNDNKKHLRYHVFTCWCSLAIMKDDSQNTCKMQKDGGQRIVFIAYFCTWSNKHTNFI